MFEQQKIAFPRKVGEIAVFTAGEYSSYHIVAVTRIIRELSEADFRDAASVAIGNARHWADSPDEMRAVIQVLETRGFLEPVNAFEMDFDWNSDYYPPATVGKPQPPTKEELADPNKLFLDSGSRFASIE